MYRGCSIVSARPITGLYALKRNSAGAVTVLFEDMPDPAELSRLFYEPRCRDDKLLNVNIGAGVYTSGPSSFQETARVQEPKAPSSNLPNPEPAAVLEETNTGLDTRPYQVVDEDGLAELSCGYSAFPGFSS